MTPVALSIAGSDPSGGAGIQADLKTFHQFGVYGEAVLTLLTVQNSRTVSRVKLLDPELVVEQLDAVLVDIPPHAAKTGALGSAAIIEAVARRLKTAAFPLVVDPVMISKHGSPLIAEDAHAVLISHLLPLAALVTPNAQEAAVLADMPRVRTVSEAQEAGTRILTMGPRAVLIKGGHLEDEPEAVDILMVGTKATHLLRAPRIDTRHTHGTGCTYSAAITAELAKGTPLDVAVARAKSFIAAAIRTNPGLGAGHGPVNHHASARKVE